MKKCFFFACTAILLFSCTPKDKTIKYIEDPSLSKVLIKGTLVIGVDDYMPILSFRNEKNEIIGYDIEIFDAVCKKMNIHPIYYPIDWAKKEELLNTGAIDCIASGFSMSKERTNRYRLITPYLQNAQVIVTLAKNHYLHFKDLKDKRIGIQKGSLGKVTVENRPEFASVQIIEYSQSQELYEMLRAESIDGIVIDFISSYDQLQKENIYAVMEEPLSAEFYTFAFRKTDKTLAEKVETVLKDLDGNGVIPALSKKWFGANLSILNVLF